MGLKWVEDGSNVESRHVNACTRVCITHLDASMHRHIWTHMSMCVSLEKVRTEEEERLCRMQGLLYGNVLQVIWLFCFALLCFALLCFALLCFVFAFQFVVRLEVTDRSVVCSVFSGTGMSRVRHIHQHSADWRLEECGHCVKSTALRGFPGSPYYDPCTEVCCHILELSCVK